MKRVVGFLVLLLILGLFIKHRSPAPVSESLRHRETDPVPLSDASGATGGGDETPKAPKANRPDAEPTVERVAEELASNEHRIEGLRTNAERVRRLAAEPLMVDEMQIVLTNAGHARRRFGHHQAEARILAIRVLGERARKGDATPLIQTAAQLADEFASLDVGRRADFRDLVTEMIDHLGADRYFADPHLLTRNFRMDPSIEREILAASVYRLGHRIEDSGFLDRLR